MRDDDELLRGHLLGRLEEEERSRLEERLIREEGLFEMAEAVEADLLDDYAHDRLAPEERELAARLASSPRGRSRLALIRGLGTIASERNVLPFPPIRQELPRRKRFAAIAAMLAIAILSSWLATRRPELVQPPQIAETRVPEQVRPPVPPDVPPPPPDEEEVIAETTPTETPVPQPAAAWVIQLALGTHRGPGEMIPQENVPPGTERVRLHLLLDDPHKSYDSFQVSVRGPGPELRVEGLAPETIDGRRTLVLDLDPKTPEGMYEVEVFAPGEDDPVAYKELEITRNASAPAVTPD